ncbi:helix-turn-helix domain-containing protein [Streptomyces hygroscopicus]|uniref:helix-turn-helix domain-containing protein n=1 Tax=Streptomyces hygroscopicus TaxID=1912 RepID=UPI0037A7811F
MAEQQPSAPPRALSLVRRSAGGLTHVSEHQPTRYTIIGNHLTQHRELSLTAIGLGAHIQSLPDGAQVDIRTLAGRFPEGRDRIAAALRELELCGYLERVRERTPEGRIVTRTFSYNDPGATRARRRAGEPRLREAAGPPAPPPVADPGQAPPSRADSGRTPRTSPGQASPSRTGSAPVPPAPPPPRVPVTPPVPPPPRVPVAPPVPPRPRTTQVDAVPTGTTPARAATSLLAELRRDDDRLLLPERDVRRLAPAVTTWLERGAAPEAVRRALSAGLPPDLRHPAALLAHRLTALLPPPLPAAQLAPRPAVVPLQNCDGCDRAFRAPKPGRCRDCREPGGALAPTAA